MAKSDSDSNGLRQDQPECSLHRAGRLGGSHTHCVEHSECDRYRNASDDTRRPSVTELPRLTSDPILTADRRGGILMFSGSERNPGDHIRPSSCVRVGVSIVRRIRIVTGRRRSRPSDNGQLTALVAVSRTSFGGRRVPRDLRIPFEGRLLLKPVEENALRHAVTWVGVPLPTATVLWVTYRALLFRPSVRRLLRGRRSTDHPARCAPGPVECAPRTRVCAGRTQRTQGLTASLRIVGVLSAPPVRSARAVADAGGCPRWHSSPGGDIAERRCYWSTAAAKIVSVRA